MEQSVDLEILRLRQRAERRRRVAQTLTSPVDIQVALDEARLAEAEAARLEADLQGKASVLIG